MNFAVIDTETNWNDDVMSLGLVIADSVTFRPVGNFTIFLVQNVMSAGCFQALSR